MSETLISALTTLIVVLDPIGLVPVFLALTHGIERERRRVAVWATGLAALVLSGFALIGGPLLEALGITLPAFRIAGGLLLFFTAFEMVFDLRAGRRQTAADGVTSEGDATAIAAFPLAIPLLAGPGAITAVILLSASAGPSVLARLPLLAVILLACFAVFLIFLVAEAIDRVLGRTAKLVLTRLFGVLLAALAVQFVADGLLSLAATASGPRLL